MDGVSIEIHFTAIITRYQPFVCDNGKERRRGCWSPESLGLLDG